MKNKIYSLINISGLAVGIAATLLIFIVVSYELSYDRFQNNYHNIYRIVTDINHTDGDVQYNPGIQIPAIDAIGNFPQFVKTAGVTSDENPQFTVLGGSSKSDVALSKKFIEENKTAVFTQPSYFDIFDAKWLTGNKNVLNEPSSVVLNKTLAEKYFGNWKNAIGKFLKIDNTILVQVNGVVEDAHENSDFPIVAFLSYEAFKKAGATYGYFPNWSALSSNNQLYVLTQKDANVTAINSQLNSFLRAQQDKTMQNEKSYILQPLKDLHFDARYETFGDHSSNKTLLLTLALIGVLIICMASINYINLATAQAINRSKEVGIRKVLGSTRRSLIAQVIGETLIIISMSTCIAIAITKLSLPYLSHVAMVPKDIAMLNANSIFFLTAEVIIVTLLSGIYPAIILSNYKPALALKNKIASASVGGISLRRILVVTQFAISQLLIIGTIVAVRQMDYVQNANLGFNKEAVLVVPAYSDSADLARMQPLKEEILRNADVSNVSFASDEAASDNKSSTNFAFSHTEDKDYPLYTKNGDEDFIKTLGLQLIAGRNFEASDTLKEVVVNETLLKKVGVNDPQKAIGKDISIGGSQWFPIVGVVKDFKTNSLKEPVNQLAIFPNKKNYSVLLVKLNTKDISRTVSQIQTIWERTYPEFAFTRHFTDETIAKFYEQETRLELLYKIFAAIAIFISCLGLYGIVSYIAAQKIKEVGIRKVLGAGIINIIYLFSKEYIILISVSFAIAAPLAWYFMNSWLEDFVYRINISIGIFITAFVASLFIALITVGYRSFRAAIANPVKSLRTE